MGQEIQLIIDRSQPFDPSFLGKGWKIDEQDERALALAKIDLNAVRLEHMLQPEDEGVIHGEEKLKRLKAAGHIRLDAAVFKALWERYAFIPENWKGKSVFFDGTILLSHVGHRCVLYICWSGGRLHWYYSYLDGHFFGSNPSAVIAPPPDSGQAASHRKVLSSFS